MKVARVTSIPNPFLRAVQPKATYVVTEKGLLVPIAALTESMKQKGGGLTVVDIFEVPDNTDDAACRDEAVRRQRARDESERLMGVMYYTGLEILRILKPDGLHVDPEPSPVSRDDAREVFLQLALHPKYKRQTLVTITKERTALGMVAGRVAILPSEVRASVLAARRRPLSLEAVRTAVANAVNALQ